MIDGAAGNPAWNHEGLLPLKEHSRWTEPIRYFWFSGGALLGEKPFRIKSFVMSTIHLPIIDQWTKCCGSPWQEHSTGRSSPAWSQAKSNEKRYPPLIWQGFVKDVENNCFRKSASVGAGEHILCSPCKSSRPKSFLPETTISHNPQTVYPRINQTDHVRHIDEITLDPENGIMTRLVTVKYTSQEDAYPL